MENKPKIPDMSEVDFDTRLKILLGVPPTKEGADDETPAPVTESDTDK